MMIFITILKHIKYGLLIKAEIEELENSIKNNFNWKSKNDDINYKNIFPIYEDAKKMLTNLGYEFVENADYF